MTKTVRVTCAWAAMVLWCACSVALAAQSAEINPFAGTQLQVDARMARINQEVTRLRDAGQFAASADLSRRLGHFQSELSGFEPSAIAGPELDAVGMYTADGDTPIVEVRATDRPVILALGAYELVHWTLNVLAGANLQKVIVSGYDGVAMPSGVPAGVPVELTSYATTGAGFFYFYSKGETSFVDAAKTLYQKTGLPPSTMQAMHHYLGQHIAVGGGTVEWTQERVLSELQPLYKEATAFQLGEDRAAADAYRFTGLFHTYKADGSWQSTQIAQMSPLKAVNALKPQVDYFYLGVDPRGPTPTYYGYHPGHTLEKFDPNTAQATALPAYGGAFGTIFGLTFDTTRNRLVVGTRGADSANGFLFLNPDAGTWQRSTIGSSMLNQMSLAYSAANDAYYTVEKGANGALLLDRFDAATLAKVQVELSQYVNCGIDRCELAASGKRLVLIAPPAVDPYEPLLPAVQHSYLIDPANGNVTILGAVPEPGTLAVIGWVGVVGLGCRRRRDTKIPIHQGNDIA